MTDREFDNDSTQSHVILTAGTMVSQYRIVEKVGSGGMGEVYLAEDTKLDRKVALKFMSYEHSRDQNLKVRFEREAQAAAKLSHPNIVHIYEVGEYQGRPFFAMEHIEGDALHHYAKVKRLGILEILDLSLQICEGLQEAHSAGIVHRDIKPHNIVVDRKGRPRLLDFGLATIAGSEHITRTGSTLGTVGYMSPEIAEGKESDQRSDLFSLGVVLYDLIAGRTPFKRDNEAATLKAIVSDTPEPLARFRSGVPDGVQQIVDKLLEKDPRTRYQSAAGVASDLLREKRLLDSGEFTSRTQPRVGQPGKSSRKKLVITGTTLIIVITLLLVLKPWRITVTPNEVAVAAENRLAILYFENLVDPTDSLRTGEIVTNLLITDLSESEHLHVVSSQRMYDILKQLGKEESHAIDRQTATQIASIANARWMLTGTILQMDPHIVVTTQIIDVKSGQIEASQRSTSEEGEDIFAQVDRLSAEIRQDLAVPGLTTEATDRSLTEVTTNSPEAYRLYIEGIDNMRKLYVTEAMECFKKAIEIDSTFAMAYYQLANRLQDDSYMRKALKYSNNASRQERLHILATADHMAGDADGAIATLKQIIGEFPDDKMAYMELSDIYSKVKGQPDEAIQYAEEVIRIDPHFKIAYNFLAYLYKRIGDYEKAIEILDKYVEIVPDEPNPYDSRGEMYAALGKFELAAESYRQALAKDPGFESSLKALVSIYVSLREYARADSCARALANDSDKEVRVIGRSLLAVSAAHQGKFKEALRILDNAKTADSLEGPRTGFQVSLKYLYEGIVFNLLGQHEKALAMIEEARRILLQDKPDNPFPFNGEYAVTLALLGKTDAALRLLEDDESIYVNKGDNYSLLFLYLAYGRIEIIRGNYPKAIEDLEKAISTRSAVFRPRAEYYLAIAHIKNKQPAKAVPLLERYTTRIESLGGWNPLEPVLGHFYLGIAYEMQGDTKNAVSQYSTFLDIWKEADSGIDEIEDARSRLARLTS